MSLRSRLIATLTLFVVLLASCTPASSTASVLVPTPLMTPNTAPASAVPEDTTPPPTLLAFGPPSMSTPTPLITENAAPTPTVAATIISSPGRMKPTTSSRAPASIKKPTIVAAIAFQIDIPEIVTAPKLGSASIIGPSVIQLKDGRFRLYLQSQDKNGVNIVSLISADGNKWTSEPGIRIQHGADSDIDLEAGEPDAYLGIDGKYYMAYTGRQPVSGSNNLLHKVVFAVSDDGLTWSKLNRSFADPQAKNDFASSADIMLMGQEYVMYYTAGTNITTATSSDGLDWIRQKTILTAGHDSTTIVVNGVYYMIVKAPDALVYPQGPPVMDSDDLLMAVSADGINWSPDLYRIIVNKADGSQLANLDLQDPTAINMPDGSLRVIMNNNGGQAIYSIKPTAPLPQP